MNAQVRNTAARKGEERARAALVQLYIKPAYISRFVDSLFADEAIEACATMKYEDIQMDYQLFVAAGGLDA